MNYVCLRNCYMRLNDGGKPVHCSRKQVVQADRKDLPKNLFAKMDKELIIDFGNVTLEVLKASSAWKEDDARSWLKANYAKRIPQTTGRERLAEIVIDTRDRHYDLPEKSITSL